ncbi:DUF2513 domain-containing protein [Paracoccus mangrovi]|uniref:DUF2513 domain-containing protein n=2 Tax=Paracoccus TaxID=265 RepID=A0ABV7R160_9RHOB
MMRRLEKVPLVYVEICRVQQDEYGNKNERWALQEYSIEEKAPLSGIPLDNKPADLSEQEVATILALRDGQFIEISSAYDGPYLDGDDLEVRFARITMSGHEFLEVTRTNSIWKKTKEAAGVAGGMALRMLFETAMDYAKAEVKSRGFPIP